jgi:hypothetical protein
MFYILQSKIVSVCPSVYVYLLSKILDFCLWETIVHEFPYTYLNRNCDMYLPLAVEACVTAIISTLAYSQLYFTHEFSHVGCRRLWTRFSTHHLSLCHSPTIQVVQVDYLLLGRGIYSTAVWWQTVCTVFLLEIKQFALMQLYT